MTTPTLGRLERVPLRDVWPSESSDFTPWLALLENMALLGETLQLDLQVEGREQRVGPFSADILCKETLTDRWVVIENQLNGTDHSHLGQLLTYAAGLEATTVVWVAERFTDEHRAALDWLNQVTTEGVHFFGLEIELWRIGDSAPAPKFNVICQPNDWSRVIKDTTKRIEDGSQSPLKQTYLAFWQALDDRIRENGSVLRHGQPKGYNYFPFAIGRTEFKLMATFTRDGKLWATLLCTDPQLWPAVIAMKASAEHETGYTLVEDFEKGRRQNYLSVHIENADLDSPDTWPPVIADLQSKLEKLHTAFAPRIRGLEAVTTGPDPGAT